MDNPHILRVFKGGVTYYYGVFADRVEAITFARETGCNFQVERLILVPKKSKAPKVIGLGWSDNPIERAKQVRQQERAVSEAARIAEIIDPDELESNIERDGNSAPFALDPPEEAPYYPNDPK